MAAKKPSIDQFIRRPSQLDWEPFRHFWAVLQDSTVRREIAVDVFRRLYGVEARERLQRFVNDGAIELPCAQALEAALGLERTAWEPLLARHAEDFGGYERGREMWRAIPDTDPFKPYIRLRHDPARRKARLFILAHADVHGMCRIMVDPGLPASPKYSQVEAVRALVGAHRHTKLGARALEMLGEPCGFSFRRALRQTWEFSPNGQLLEEHEGYIWEPGVHLEVVKEVAARAPAVNTAVRSVPAKAASPFPLPPPPRSNWNNWDEIYAGPDGDAEDELLSWAGLSAAWYENGLHRKCCFMRHVADRCPWVYVDPDASVGGPGTSCSATSVSTCNGEAARKDLRNRVHDLCDLHAEHVLRFRRRRRA